MRLGNRIFRTSLQKAISQAGPRYTPGLADYKNFPSIPISDLLKAIDGLERNNSFWLRFSSLESSLSSQLKNNRALFLKKFPDSISQLDLAACKTACEKLAYSLNNIVSFGKSLFGPIDYKMATRHAKNCHKVLIDVRSVVINKLHALRSSDEKNTERNEFENFDYELRRFLELISEIEELLFSQSIALSNNPTGLLLGTAGTGKTHFLCDIAKSRMMAGKPTIIALAKNMVPHKDLWQSLLLTLGLKCTRQSFFKFLKARAISSKTRSVVIFDGINEADRILWQRGLKRLLREVEAFQEIAVLISCRSPFQREFVRKSLFGRLVFLEHRGFYGIEFDAQKEFFEYYGLNLHEVPILAEEFSNPLFLKIFCESIADAVVKKQHKQIKEISSGQKGMTYIFERLVEIRQNEIWGVLKNKYRRNPFRIKNWLWNKGRTAGLIKDVALDMALQKSDYINKADFSTTLGSYLFDHRLEKEARRLLLSSDIFFEDMIWEGNSYKNVIRISYQRFSDHLVARTILQNINCRNAKDVKTMLRSWRDKQSVIEALVVDFPLRSDGKELLDYFSREALLMVTCESFVDGLVWRESRAFNKSTIKWINRLINDDSLQNHLFDVLFSVATKPDHPLGANVFDKFLSGMKMPERDLLWTEFLRKRWAHGSVLRMLIWIESVESNHIKLKNAAIYIRLLRWLLTSTNKYFRNRTTKAIYRLGLLYPLDLFETTIDSLRLNDPYVPERMLAASYGVVMTLHVGKESDVFLNVILPRYAESLYRMMFIPKARFATTHVLMRDYARFTIEIALMHKLTLMKKNQVKRVRPPFKDGGIRRWGKSIDQTKKGEGHPIQMDFENYTIGRLVKNRLNYEDNHADYKVVKANIYWRLYQLGFNAARFSDIDREIANESFYMRNEGRKIERYGKKYSWIAFFELYGFRQDEGLINSYEYGCYDRPSDCDIDPSFPDEPHKYRYITRNLLGHSNQRAEDWIGKIRFPPARGLLLIDAIGEKQGPWLTLYGYARQVRSDMLQRSTFYVHGLLIKEKDLKQFLKALHEGRVHLHDLQAIPAGYYTYAGEIPWCETFPNSDPREIRFTDYPFEKQRKGFEVLVPTFEYAWESYHSTFNNVSHTVIPSKQQCKELGLSLKLPTWELVDTDGEICAEFLRLKKEDQENELCVIRKEMFDSFLNNNKVTLIWVLLLDRQILPPDRNGLPKNEPHMKSFDVIAKVYHYQDGMAKEKFIRRNL